MHNNYYDDEYIKRIYELLENNPDLELITLINNLVEERRIYRKYALEDELTKANNRRVLQNKNIKYKAVVMCDVDNFKSINDKYGHVMGDVLLEQIANKIQDNIRDTDLLCRYGGDEFVIIFKSCKIENAVIRMNVIKESLSELKDIYHIPVTISFGVAEYEFGKPLMDAIEEADKALYESKKSGRDRITLFRKNRLVKRKHV